MDKALAPPMVSADAAATVSVLAAPTVSVWFPPTVLDSFAPTDFDREDIDLAVTYGKGDWSGVVADKLLGLDFFPVCSPAFLANDNHFSSSSGELL